MSLLTQLRELGLTMGGSFPPREFTTEDEAGEQVTVMRRLVIGYTTDGAKADAAREAGATVTHCRATDTRFSGWEVSVNEVFAMPDDYDKVWAYERDEEQSLWDEAHDEASLSRADDFREHTEDVP